MYGLPNYDNWKTTPPDEQKPIAQCNICGEPLYEGEVLIRIDGGICEECFNNNYKIIL